MNVSNVCCVREDATKTLFLPDIDNSDRYKKLIEVLTNILRPGFKTLDCAVLEKLFTIICSEGKRSQEDYDILLPILHKWLTKANENWSTIVPKSRIFVLKIASYVACMPQGFALLSTSGVLENLLSRFEEPSIMQSPLKLAFIELLIPLANHREGSNFIIHKGLWRKVIAFTTSNDNCYSFQKYSDFLTNFLQGIDDDVPLAIFQHVVDLLTPLLSFTAESPRSDSCNLEPDAKIVGSLSLCRITLLALMENNLTADKLKAQCEFCDIVNSVIALCSRAINKEMLREATKFLCTLNSLVFYQTKDKNGLLPVEVAEKFIDLILRHLWLLVSRRLFDELLDMCTEYHSLLHKFGAQVSGNTARDSDGRPYDVSTYIDNLLFMIQVIMAFMCFRPLSNTKWNCAMEDYIDKLYRLTDNKVMRNSYMLRDALITVGDRIWNLGITSIKRFTLICPIVQRELGLLIFQAMAHFLGQCSMGFLLNNTAPSTSGSCKSNYNDSAHIYYPTFTSSCLICIHSYLTRFSFTWRDSLESLNLLDILLVLLESPHNTWGVIVDILRTIGLVLQKFMPPNLALLINTLEGSGTEDLGPKLVNLLQNEEWAVRDSALEVIKIIIGISGSRFPAFQTMLIELKIPQTILDIVQNDEEPFVRTNALSCLYELADVPDVWSATLEDKNVVKNALLIVHYEPEGIVRKMAVDMIAVLLTKQKIRLSELETVYKSMYCVTLKDLHWEVRLAGIDFWHTACSQNATGQGLLDGVFPEAIFSKEKKRIIILTPEEIKRVIMTCLDIMENQYVFQIIWEAFTNDPELAISEKASKFVESIKNCKSEIFKITTEDWENFKSKVNRKGFKSIEDRRESFHVADEGTMEIVKEKETTANDIDSVIEEIVSQRDSELLSRLEISTHRENPHVLPEINRIHMTFTEFLEKSQSVDVPQSLKARYDWLININNGLDSLVDDILLLENKICSPHSGPPINIADCY